MKPDSDMIEMKVTGLTIDPFTNMPIVVLKDLTENRALPIWVGLIEASSIATEIEKVPLSRPMTHDLMKNMLDQLQAQVFRVEISDLTDNTFFARIFLKAHGQEFILDSRPSDAISIALRCNAPLFVDKKVIEKSRRIDLGATSGSQGMKEKKWTEILENLTSDDFGKYKM